MNIATFLVFQKIIESIFYRTRWTASDFDSSFLQTSVMVRKYQEVDRRLVAVVLDHADETVRSLLSTRSCSEQIIFGRCDY